MTKPFVHLHNHSSFSVLDGASKVQEMVETVANDGSPALGITDHGVLYGLPEFYKECKAADVNPVLGCEVYFTDDRLDRSPIGKQENRLDGSSKRYYHLTILAKDNVGYQNLIKLSSDAYLNGFFYKPRADWSTVEKYSDGLIATSGCLGGPVLQHLLHDDYSGALETASRLQDIFGKDSFYIEIQDQGLPEQAKTNPELIRIAHALDAPLVATNDSHYVHSDDAMPHDHLLCIQTSSLVSDQDRFRFQSDQHYLKSADEMRHLFRDIEESCDNTLLIGEQANVTLDFDTLHIPPFPIPHQFKDGGEFLATLSKKGLQKRYGDKAPEYYDKLQYELSVIETLGLSTYFLIVWDICRFADQNNIPRGPGRGSVAGSLVAYCMNISKVDPIRHDLMFERFLNPSRIAMPDIDLDFSPDGREMIINYIAEKYGNNNTAQIITYGLIRARSAIRDSTRVLGLSPGFGDKLAKMMPDHIMGEPVPLEACFKQSSRFESAWASAEELRKTYEENSDARKVLDSALKLEGLIRQTGVHPAGVLITPGPVTDYVPTQQNGEDEPIVTQYDKDTCEDLGLLKMDILGLRNLDVIDFTVQSVLDKVDIENVDFDDEKTFQLFKKGNTVGVFQLESPPMRDLLRRMAPDSIDDIAAVVALYRPGPMGTNMHIEYADRKNGRSPISYFHEDAKEFLGKTYGLMIYQEQAMQMAQKFAGYSGAEADNLRKIIGKKLVDKMIAEKSKFVQGCIDSGYGEELGEKLFNMIESFASYAFNKSHAYGYAYLAYQTAYLKANYTTHYMAWLCDSVKKNSDKLSLYISECNKLGIEVRPPKVNYADTHFKALDDHIIITSFDAVSNVGHTTAENLVNARGKGYFKTIDEIVAKANLDHTSFKNLVLAGAFDGYGTRLGLYSASKEIIDIAKKRQKDDVSQQIKLFDNNDFWDIDISEAEYPEDEKLHLEKDAIGTYITGHPLNSLQDFATETQLESIEPTESTVEILVTITNIDLKRTRRGNLMAVITVSDLSGQREVLAFENTWRRHEDSLTENTSGVMEIKTRYDDVAEETILILNFFAPVKTAGQTVVSSDTLNIRLPRGFASNTLAVSKLKGLLLSHHGKVPVKVLVSPNSELDLKLEYTVDPNEGFLTELSALFKRYSADKRLKVGS